MISYLPTAHSLGGLLGLAMALVLFFVLGAAVCGRETLAETRLLAGWGVACLVFTAWGVATPVDLRWPLAALLSCSLAAMLVPRSRSRIGSLGGMGRMLVLGVPLIAVMAPVRPSEIDTWLNLLPNAAYLFDYGMLPTSTRAASYSFLPVAPYNTQFAAFVASVLTGSLSEGVMGLFNTALLLAAALCMARVIWRGNVAAQAGTPPWWACALGLLIAIPANPGFVPRVFLSPYGEAPLAVTVLFAVLLATSVLDELRHVAWPRALVALSLVLTAMVNIKQSGLGLVLPVGATMLALGLAHPAIPNRRAIAASGAVLVPALALYGVWRWFAVASFPEGELKLLPIAEWNWPLLPSILLAMLHVAAQKAAYFVVEGAALGVAVWQLRRGVRRRDALLLGMITGVTVLFTGFLLFTYVAHFPPIWALEAHSFFRYSSQLSLAAMLAVVVALRPLLLSRLPSLSSLGQRRLGAGMIALAAALPFAGARLLRFDLDTPQPQLRQIALDAAPFIHPGDRLALLLPDDRDDADASMLRGVLMFEPPRRPRLDLRIETKADPATLAALVADGFSLALVTCTPAALADAPPGHAALLHYADGVWKTVETTAYPPDLADQRFAAMLQRGPVCAGRGPAVTATSSATR